MNPVKLYVLLPGLIIAGTFAFRVFREVRKKGAANTNEGRLRLGWMALSVFCGCVAALTYDFALSDEIDYYFRVGTFFFLFCATLIVGLFSTKKFLLKESDKFMQPRQGKKASLQGQTISPEDRVRFAHENNKSQRGKDTH